MTNTVPLLTVITGNAAYLAANHHVYIVMNILSVSMILVIVPYLLLYRTMKPAQQQTQLRTVDSVATIELSAMTKNHLEEHNDKDDIILKHISSVDNEDMRTSDLSRGSVSELEQRDSEEDGGTGMHCIEGSGKRGKEKRVGSECVLLLRDMELGEDELEEDQL